MDKSRLCLILSCRKAKIIGRYCVRHYGEKFWLQIKLCLEELYSSCPNIRDEVEKLLPSVVGIKDFCNFLSFLRITYNLGDVKTIIKEFSGRNNFIVSRDKVLDYIFYQKVPETPNNMFKTLPVFTKRAPSPFKDTEQTPKNLSPTSELLNRLSRGLKKSFCTYEEAFERFSNSPTLKYFQFSRIFEYLNIQTNEKNIKNIMFRSSKSGEISKKQFKTLWFNKDNLCKAPECRKKLINYFGYCKKHNKNASERGKSLMTSIFKVLDARSQNLIKECFMDGFELTTKNVKAVLSPFCQISLTDKDWENVAVYILEKVSQKEESFMESQIRFFQSPTSFDQRF